MPFRLLATYLALLFIALPMQAQESPSSSRRGVVEGTVTGEDGRPLAGVNVFVPDLERGTATRADGSYRLAGLPARTLVLRFSFVGYETDVRRVTTTPGEPATLDVTMTPSLLQGKEITVTGTPTAQDPLQATQDVDVVSPEELDLQRTAALGDVLERSVPGAASVKTGSQAGKPVLRGLSGNRIRLLKNGIAQEYYQFGVRHFPTTSLNEAERIEVVRGASSILYGSDALGGAINVITKPLPDAGLGGRAGAQYFSNNNERAGALELSGGTGSDARTVGFRVGVERRVAGNFTTPDAPTFFETGQGGRFGDPKYTGEIPFTDFAQWSGYGQAGLGGGFGSVQLFGSYWQNRHNFILPTGGPDDDNPENPSPVGLGQHLEQMNLALKGSLLAGSFVIKPRLSWQRAVRQSAGAGSTLAAIDGAEDDFAYPVDLAKDVYTGRLEVLHPDVRRLSGTLGLEATYQDGTSRGPVPLEPTSTAFNLGVFAFEELRFSRLTLSAGGRLDYRRQTADPPQETRDALGLSESDLERTYTTLSGSLGANYRLVEGVALVSNLGAGFRAPSIFELYANGVHGGVAALQQGNPDLSPERAYSFDLGLRARTGRVTGEITAYQNRINHYIYLQNTGRSTADGPPIYASEQTNATISGLETALEVAVLPWMQLGGQAAFLTSKGEDLEASGGARRLPLIPADRLGGFVRFSRGRTGVLERPYVRADVRHAFAKDAAGRYEPFSQFDNEAGPPPFGTASTKAYTLIDVEAGGTLALGRVPVSISFGASNLLDAAYRNFLDTYKGYALSPGRNVTLKMSVPVSTVR